MRGCRVRSTCWPTSPRSWSAGAPAAAVTRMGTQRSAAPFEDRHNLAAMRYIASAPTVNLGSDVRVNYWTQPFSGTVWGQYQTDIQKLKYPGDGKGFSRNDFTSLQSELFTEIDWLIKAKDFLTGTAACHSRSPRTASRTGRSSRTSRTRSS